MPARGAANPRARPSAPVAELVDALDSKSSFFEVPVRVRPGVPKQLSNRLIFGDFVKVGQSTGVAGRASQGQAAC